jgi:hypothetical protein
MTRKIKQYKPIGFGDRPGPGTVEAHRNAMDEAAEKRRYNHPIGELEREDAARRGGWLAKVVRFFSAKAGRR